MSNPLQRQIKPLLRQTYSSGVHPPVSPKLLKNCPIPEKVRFERKALSTLATIVAEFAAIVAENSDCRRIRQQSPKSATIVASVDRA